MINIIHGHCHLINGSTVFFVYILDSSLPWLIQYVTKTADSPCIKWQWPIIIYLIYRTSLMHNIEWRKTSTCCMLEAGSRNQEIYFLKLSNTLCGFEMWNGKLMLHSKVAISILTAQILKFCSNPDGILILMAFPKGFISSGIECIVT